jgi:hypothetical protein
MYPPNVSITPSNLHVWAALSPSGSRDAGWSRRAGTVALPWSNFQRRACSIAVLLRNPFGLPFLAPHSSHTALPTLLASLHLQTTSAALVPQPPPDATSSVYPRPHALCHDHALHTMHDPCPGKHCQYACLLATNYLASSSRRYARVSSHGKSYQTLTARIRALFYL